MKYLALFFLIFTFIAKADEPFLDAKAISCGEFYFLKVQSNTAEGIESKYCGYVAGRYPPFMLDSRVFSTKENAEGYIIWRNSRCKVGESSSLKILEEYFPNHTINCHRYHGFSRIIKEKMSGPNTSTAPELTSPTSEITNGAHN